EKISKRTVQVLLAGTWLYALLWAVFPLVGVGTYGPEPFGLSCTLAWAEMKKRSPFFVISLFAMNLAIPAIIIICCYSGIILRLHLSYKTLENANIIRRKVKIQRRLML
ncbi:opsin-5-like, partial [Clarias magur]